MRKLQLFLILALIIFAGCGKSNFFDKYPPEIMYYQNADVENADFNSITLAPGITQYTVKARVSAPYILKDIKVFKGTKEQPEKDLLATYTDFTLTPNVLKVSNTIDNITVETIVKIVATDMNNHVTSKLFTIKVTP
jgi:hypothetical protein